jgi:diguanylate cyclase (GGDEF)-like protein/PAS domain S-box-containing protein
LTLAARAMSGESVSAQGAPRRRKDGTIAYLDISLTPLRDEDDTIVGVTAIARDVTEQRRLQAELVNAVSLLDESQASAHVGSWSLETETGLTRWSREHFALHGLQPRDGAPSEAEFLAVVHPEDRAKVLRPLSVLDETENVYEGEYRVVLGTGAVRTLASRIELLAPDPERGRPRRFSGTTWDITIEREARAAQRATEQRHSRLLATLPDAMVILYDAELRLQLIQGGLVAELGIDPAALEGRSLHELITNDKQRILPELIGRALAGESTSIDLDLRDEPGSPLDHIFQIEFGPYYGEGGAIVGAFTVWRDVTQRILHEEQNRMLATVVQQSSDAIEAKDLAGVVTEWSGAAQSLYGFTREEAVGRQIGELILPDDRRDEEAEALARARAGESTQVDTVRRHKDGHLVHVSISQSPIHDANGEVVGVAVIARDIADRIRQEQARRAIAEQLRVTVEHAPIGVAVIDLGDGDDGRLRSANPAFSRLFADPDPAAAGATLSSLIHRDDAQALRADLGLLASGHLGRIEVEVRVLRPDGELRWLLLTGSAVPAADGTPHQAIVHALDIGERKRFEDQLQHLADHDPLTGLFNRRRFEQELTRTVSFVERYATPSALFLIDLDGFKAVNDTLGHSYGDEILTRVSAALRSTLRETDVIGRLGGDEFAVIVNSVGAPEAQVVAEKVLTAIRQHGVVASEHQRAGVSASIGVTLLDHEARLDGDALLARADAAMYAAKQDGRDRIAFAAANAR